MKCNDSESEQPHCRLLSTCDIHHIEGGSTALGCVPLRPAAWSVSLLQLVYGSVRVYLATQTDTEQRTFSFYLHFSGHCVSLAAAVLLILGLL